MAAKKTNKKPTKPLRRQVTTVRQLKEMLADIPDEYLDTEVRVKPCEREQFCQMPLGNQKMRCVDFLSIRNSYAFYDDHQEHNKNTTDGVVDEDTYVYLEFEWESF